MSRIRIIGVGNPLMGDDGVGIAAVQRLAEGTLPPGVEVIDGGTGGVTLLTLMEGAQAAIILDAIDMGKAPGALCRLGVDELLLPEPNCGFSLHETGVGPVLALGRELGILPPVTLMGVQPQTVKRGMGLSQPVREALEKMLRQVQELLATLTV